MKRILSTLCISLFGILYLQAQTIATFEVNSATGPDATAVPVNVNLDQVTFLPADQISLYEITGGSRREIPFQLDEHQHRNMYWQVMPSGQTKHTYQLVKSAPHPFDLIRAEDKDGSLTIESAQKNLLRFQYHTVYPPAGIDTAYRRSGFIHPLWTPAGQELTRIQPKDHYHHYGIWNPWTHVLFEKDTVDFWNLRDRKGTVRFTHFASVTDGPVYSEYQALLDHVVFKKDGSEKIALHEMQTVRVYKPADNSDYFIVDFTSQLNCATQSPFHILAYRYAGFGWRATEFWDKNNMEVLTSEGKTRTNTDNTRGRWILSQGKLPENQYGGLVMMSYPANYNHPEPMRIWDQNANGGRGDYFASFAPTKNMDWILEPGHTYVLRYRLLVYSGTCDAKRAETAWQNFAGPPDIKITKNK